MQNSGNFLPYFVTQNTSVNYILNISGFPELPAVGSYDMDCVGVDTGPWETFITFMFVVKRKLLNLTVLACYYKCDKCWNSDYNTCTKCKAGYYLLSSECMYPCIDGTFIETVKQICEFCPTECSICNGKNHTN